MEFQTPNGRPLKHSIVVSELLSNETAKDIGTSRNMRTYKVTAQISTTRRPTLFPRLSATEEEHFDTRVGKIGARIVHRLFLINGIDLVYLEKDQVSVKIDPNFKWDQIEMEILQVLAEECFGKELATLKILGSQALRNNIALSIGRAMREMFGDNGEKLEPIYSWFFCFGKPGDRHTIRNPFPQWD